MVKYVQEMLYIVLLLCRESISTLSSFVFQKLEVHLLGLEAHLDIHIVHYRSDIRLIVNEILRLYNYKKKMDGYETLTYTNQKLSAFPLAFTS